MLEKLQLYFLLFIIYSVIGWILEVIYALYMKHKLTNRGFLIGPYCPIYGIGCILITTLLSGYKEHPAGLFVLAIVIASTLEYVTSYLMEKIFKARWWDYSKTKYNINGRICLDTMLPFGIIACIVVYLINPFIMNILDSLSTSTIQILSIIIAIVFITDIIASFNIVNNFKKTIKKASLEDRTEDIHTYLRDILSKKSLFHRRLLKAFPTSRAIIKKVTRLDIKKD